MTKNEGERIIQCDGYSWLVIERPVTPDLEITILPCRIRKIYVTRNLSDEILRGIIRLGARDAIDAARIRSELLGAISTPDEDLAAMWRDILAKVPEVDLLELDERRRPGNRKEGRSS